MVRAIMIVEMMGKPPEHLTKSIEKHIGVLNDVRDAIVHSIEVSVPKEVPVPEGLNIPRGEKLFSAFAEADFEVETMARLTQIMFDFMPSSVEIIEPSIIKIASTDATDLMNNISGRLHRYDEIAKTAGMKIKQLNSQLEKANQIIDEKNQEIEGLKKETKKQSKKNKSSKKTVKKKDVKKKKAESQKNSK
jgi:hypothetical protein